MTTWRLKYFIMRRTVPDKLAEKCADNMPDEMVENIPDRVAKNKDTKQSTHEAQIAWKHWLTKATDKVPDNFAGQVPGNMPDAVTAM